MLRHIRSVFVASAIVRAAMASVSVFLLSPANALAGSSALTLDEATRLAEQRAPMLDARRAGISAAREEAARAGALPDPMLSVGIDNLPVTGRDAFDSRADDMTMKRIGLRQEIPSAAKREARRTLAIRGIDEARALSEAERLAVRRAAAEAWIDLWTAQRELVALQALRNEAAVATKLAEARVAGSSEPVSNALAAEAAVLELDNRIEAASATQTAAQVGLARWLGDGVVETTDEAPNFGALPVPETRLLTAIDRLGPLLPTSAQVETAAAAIDVARAEKRPDWSVGTSYGQRAGGRSDMIMFEVGIGLPLFTRNRQDRSVSAREADYQAALSTREDLRRQEVARIRGDIARWEGLKRQVALHETSSLPLARDRSMTALAAYRAGGELQPWLNARRDELDVHLSHAQHLGDLGRAWAALAYLLPSEEQP
jgi:outer membrane protein, heavy metal efflux system